MVFYNNYHKSYVVNLNGKYFVSYSEGRFGEYAKTIAELSNKTHQKYNNYYIDGDDDNTMILKIYSSTHGYIDITFDKELHDKISKFKWCMHKPNDGRNIYIISSTVALARFIMGATSNDNNVVYHLDSDHTNYRLNNLAIMNVFDFAKFNQANIDLYSDENRIWKNVKIQYHGNRKQYSRFRIRYSKRVNGKSVKVVEDISFNIDNYEEKKHQAIITSILRREANCYKLTPADLAYLEENSLYNKSEVVI